MSEKLGTTQIHRTSSYNGRTVEVTVPVIRCDCGEELVMRDSFTNTCECGLDYNGSGQQLAPRSQWGAETGETATSILEPGDPFDDW